MKQFSDVSGAHAAIVAGLIERAEPCENKRAPALHGGGLACGEAFNCCDCGGHDCGCRYCFSCNACDACKEE